MAGLKDARRKTQISKARSLASNFDVKEQIIKTKQEHEEKFKNNKQIFYVSLDDLKSNPMQNDTETQRGSLVQLKHSIETFGLISPIIVIPDEEQLGKYIIVAGHRRAQCYRELKEVHGDSYKTIPAILLDAKFDTKEQTERVVLEENLFREPPTIDMIFTHIQYVLQSAANMSQKEYKEFMETARNKKLTRVSFNYPEFVYQSLKFLNIPNWSLSSVRRYLIVLDYAIDEVLELFKNRSLSLSNAANIAEFDEKRQKQLIEIFDKEGLEAMQIAISKSKLEKKTEAVEQTMIIKSTLKKMSKTVRDIQNETKLMLSVKTGLTKKDMDKLKAYEMELKNTLATIEEIKQEKEF